LEKINARTGIIIFIFVLFFKIDDLVCASVAVNNPPCTAIQVKPPVNKPVVKIASKLLSPNIFFNYTRL